MEIKMVDVGKIKSSPFQTRGNFNEEDLKGLAKTYGRGGIIVPLSVREKTNGYFELISGERRLRAAKIAEFKQVPCLVKKLSNGDARFQQLITNTQRKDLDPLGRAQAINSLMQAEGCKATVISRRIGVPDGTLSNWLSILKMPIDIQKKLSRVKISGIKIQKIARLSSDDDKRLIFEKVAKEETPRKRVYEIVDAFKEIDAESIFTVGEKKEAKKRIIEAEEYIESPKMIIADMKLAKTHSGKIQNLQDIGEFALKLAKQMGDVAKKLSDLGDNWKYLPEGGQRVILSHLDELNRIRKKLEKGSKNGSKSIQQAKSA